MEHSIGFNVSERGIGNNMKIAGVVLLVIAVLILCFAFIAVWISRVRTRRIMEHMNQMLLEAEKGTFNEKIYDESLLSEVETRLAHYLSASQVSAKNLAEEKAHIQELIADISHQTKTPLSNILLYAELLKEQALEPEAAEYVQALSAQSEKLNFLIQSLVKTSRLETGILTLFPKKQPLQPLLEQVETEIRVKAKQKQIVLQIAQTEETADFDLKWTEEAIYNLVDNAVKYTPVGGKIEIEVSTTELFVRVDIKDNGIGISEEEHAQIFKRFYRSSAVSDQEGVGIGLYLSRQILKEEGGYIKLSSTPGKGSVFSVFLKR